VNPLEDLRLKETVDGIEVEVRAIPGASVNAITGIRQGALVVKVTTAPERVRQMSPFQRYFQVLLAFPRVMFACCEESISKTRPSLSPASIGKN